MVSFNQVMAEVMFIKAYYDGVLYYGKMSGLEVLS